MPSYRITWEMDIDAPTARDAVLEARRIQLDPESIATCFEARSVTWVKLDGKPSPAFGAPLKLDIEGVCPYCKRREGAHYAHCKNAPSDPYSIDVSTKTVQGRRK